MDEQKENVMKCPFRKLTDNQYADCYGAQCMAYYERPYFGCLTGTDEPKSTPICMLLLQNDKPVINPYQTFGNYIPFNYCVAK